MHIKAYVKEATLDRCRKIQLSVRVVEQEIFMSASQRARAVERTFSFVCESISVPALFLYSNVRLFQVHFQTTLNYLFFIHHASSHWQNCFTHKSRGNWRNYWGLKKIIFQCTFLKSVNAAPSIVSPSCLLKEIGRVFFFFPNDSALERAHLNFGAEPSSLFCCLWCHSDIVALQSFLFFFTSVTFEIASVMYVATYDWQTSTDTSDQCSYRVGTGESCRSQLSLKCSE